MKASGRKMVWLYASLWAVTVIFAGHLLFTSCTYQGDTPDISGHDIRLTILHTSDIHSRVYPFSHAPMYTEQKLGMSTARDNYGGLSRIAHVIKRERAKAGRVLYLDSGDVFQGAPIFNVFAGEPEFRALSEMRLDAFVIGNHEFDGGPQNLADMLEQFADFPVLASNYIFDEHQKTFAKQFNRKVKPFTVFNMQGLRVGVIGMANLSSVTSLEDGGNSLGIIPLETIQTLQGYVNMIRDEVDLVVVLSHLGLGDDEMIAQNVCGIDVIMGGHHHVALKPSKVIAYDPDPDIVNNLEGVDYCPDWVGRTCLVVHSNAFAKFVGRLDLVIRDGFVMAHKFDLFPIDNETPEDPDMAYLLEPYYEEMLREFDLSRQIAYAQLTLRRFGAIGGDSMLGNFVCEAMQFRRGVETDFCVTNSLGMRTDILEGDVQLETMFNVLPFENTITTMYLSGVEVQQLLDYATDRSAGRGCNSQIQVSGVSFRMNCRTGKAENILMNGEPLQPESVYELATNNYIAWGGSGFDVLKRNSTKKDTGISMRDAVIDYMKEHPLLPECYDTYSGAVFTEPVAVGEEGYEEYLQYVEYLERCKNGLALEDGRIQPVF